VSGQVVVLNGAPRSGKSSIVAALQEDAPWINLGVDVARATTPPQWQPGVGLRPGEDGHPASAEVPRLYAALYESVAAHSRLGFAVAVDVGHYDRALVADAARRLDGLPVLFVGVRCPLEVIEARRRAADAGRYLPGGAERWQEVVHGGWAYDLELDTSLLRPEECAAAIRRRLGEGPGTAFAELS
jgi:chloramphenicol 3-O phosphotransferase